MLFEDLIYFSVCYVVSEIQAKSTIYVNKSLWTKKFGTLSPGIKKTRLNKYATFIVFSFRQTRITTKKKHFFSQQHLSAKIFNQTRETDYYSVNSPI